MIERTSAEIRAHRSVIEAITQRWFDGEISMLTKRQLIREANTFFYGDKTQVLARRRLVAEVAEPEPEREPVPAQGALWEDEDEEKEPWWQR